MSTAHAQSRKQNVPNWKKKQSASHASNNTNNEKPAPHKSVAHFSTLISQPTVSPTIPFEALICAFLITHLFVQHYNIYSTNFYNYDFDVLWFSFSLMSLRLLIKFIGNHQLSSPFQKVAATTTTNAPSEDTTKRKNAVDQTPPTVESYRYRVRWRVLALHIQVLVLFNAVIYYGLHISYRYGMSSIFFSLLPFFVYITLFYGPRVGAIIRYKKELMHQTEKKPQQHQTIQQRSIIDAPMQFKLLLYSTFEWTYYAGIFPLIYTPHHVYFEVSRCVSHIVYMTATLMVLLSLQLLANHFLKFVSHTHFFGYWQLIDSQETDKNVTISNWSANRKPYSKGSVVQYEGKTYIAMGEHNYGVPGQVTDRVLFLLFCEKPDRSHCYLICIQSAITLSQLLLFLSSTIQTTAWDAISVPIGTFRPRPHFELISWEVCIVMLLFNYYATHMCVWVRRETLRFLLVLAQTTAAPTITSITSVSNTPKKQQS